MLIQCDQCNTKFKLDDAKVPDKGVKVRCAKCKHVFMAQKETSTEESDLDFLLSGLGATASDAEKALSPAGETISPPIDKEERRPFAQGPDIAGEGSSGLPSAGIAEQAQGGESGGDFFAVKEGPAAQEEKGLEPGEFSFEDEETLTSYEAGAAPETPVGNTGEFEFGAFPFEGESTAESGAADAPTSVPPETEGFDFNKFAVPPVVDEAENPPFAAQEEKTEVETVPSDFGDIEFGEADVAGPAVKKEEEKKPDKEVSLEPVAETVSTPIFSSSMQSAEEELPPLAISTRKKGGSFFPFAVTTIALLLVLAIAGVGFYVFKTGPAAFNKLGLSFLAKWVGMEVPEEGGIAIKNPQGAFMVNREVGEIFVVSGEAINNFKKPRASIQIKAIVLGPKGEIVMQKSAYCGNVLSKEQLATLPMAKIEEAMGSPFGDSLANLGVQPGKGIPFVIVFNGVQKNAAEFSVEVVGSTLAGQ